MSSPPNTFRNTRRGIVLISTLLSLTLIIGIVSLVQSQALATVKVLKRLEASEVAAMKEASEREVLRPVLVGAVLELMNGAMETVSVIADGQFSGPNRCFFVTKVTGKMTFELRKCLGP